MLSEFKKFALRGNVIDLAVGVIIGVAFNAIVTSLVKDIFMPVVGLITGGMDFSGLSYAIGDATITYGNFIQAIFIFLLTALALFLFIRAINRLKRKEEAAPQAPAELPADIKLLTEIRDLLRK
jgi:large conductance mechanosensitive channel